MLKVSGLVKEFKSNGNSVAAVDKMDLTIEDGLFAAFVGESGSGKSTLLSLLGALAKPTAGSIEVDGSDITGLSDSKLIEYRKNSVGFIFQNYSLVPNLSSLENVMLPMEFAGMGKEDRKMRAAELLLLVGLEGDKQKRKPGRLSGGEQQRVGIARALSNEPKIILADEPTGNLDSKTGASIVRLLHDLASLKDVTVITATHDSSIEEQCDRVYRIRDGRLVEA